MNDVPTGGCLIGTWTPTARAQVESLKELLESFPQGIQLQRGSMTRDQVNHPRLWEYAMVVGNLDASQKDDFRVLDVGGAGSFLGIVLARRGIGVWTTDLFDDNVALGNQHGLKFALPIHASKGMPQFALPFDAVVSVNVIEHVMEWVKGEVDKGFAPGHTNYWEGNHVPSAKEVEAERRFVQYCASNVRPGGKLIITFDYATAGGFRCQPRCAYMRSEVDVMARIVEPSNLELMGPLDLIPQENVDRFNPPASTGIVVLRKPE